MRNREQLGGRRKNTDAFAAPTCDVRKHAISGCGRALESASGDASDGLGR